MDNQDRLGCIMLAIDGELTTGLRRLARERSMTIFEAESAAQAVQFVRGVRPTLIVVQVDPEGTEALTFIRLANSTTRHVPLIAAATRHSPRLEEAVLRAGGIYYIIPGTTPGLLDPVLEAVRASERRT